MIPKNGTGIVYIALAVAHCCAVPSFGQNLVPNGSFEEFNTNCGFQPVGYQNLLNWGYVQCGNPPSLIHDCSGHIPDSPGYGHQYPHDGLAFTIIWTLVMHADGGYPDGNPRIYATVDLTQALVPGQHYCLSLWINRADSSNYKTGGFNAFFWYGVPTTCNGQDQQWDTYSAVSWNISQVDTADWVQLEGEFTPTEAYTNLTLGAFQQGTEIDSVFLQHYDTWGGADLAIYFIDDVQLWPCQVGYNELGDDANAVQLFPNPAGDVLRLRTSTKGDLRLVVTDALGRECPVPPSVGSGASDGTFDLDVGSLAVGSYLLSITQGARMSVSKPFTIAR